MCSWGGFAVSILCGGEDGEGVAGGIHSYREGELEQVESLVPNHEKVAMEGENGEA